MTKLRVAIIGAGWPGQQHVHEGGINHRLAVRVVVTTRVTANLGAFSMLAVGKERQVMAKPGRKVKKANHGRRPACSRPRKSRRHAVKT